MNGHIAIIGAGDLGATLGKILSPEQTIKYWDKSQKQGLVIESKLKNALIGADIVLLCVPTLANQKLIKSYKKYINRQAVVVTFSKGLTADGLTAPEMLKKHLAKNQPIVFVGGPMLFAEIGAGKLWWPVVCSSDKKERLRIVKLFKNITVKQANNSIAGAIAGVAKNCYALSVGVAAAADWGSNTLGRLLAQAVFECHLIVDCFAIDGDRKQINNIALADLMATSLSPWSKNRSAGQAIYNGQTKVQSEGTLSIAPFVKRLGKKKTKNTPLLLAINEIVNHRGDANLILQALK
jgi:glycerol-3-phosphate dehydrogenase (NAD(P)+)